MSVATQNIPQIPINQQDIDKMILMLKIMQSQQSPVDTGLLTQATTPVIGADRTAEVARDEEEESPRQRGSRSSGGKSKSDKSKGKDIFK